MSFFNNTSDGEPKKMQLEVIQSKQFIDVTHSAQFLGLASDLNVYVTIYVWKRYIVWNNGENESFNVQQSQHEREDRILLNALNLIEINKNELPEKELYFNSSIIVRKFQSIAEPELALFKLNFTYNENDALCLVIDAVNIA